MAHHGWMRLPVDCTYMRYLLRGHHIVTPVRGRIQETEISHYSNAHLIPPQKHYVRTQTYLVLARSVVSKTWTLESPIKLGLGLRSPPAIFL